MADNYINPLDGTKFVDKSIYQANPLIEACRGMDLMQGRLYYLALMALSPQLTENNSQDGFQKIIFDAKDIIKLFGGRGGYHANLMKKTRQLREYTVTIITGKDDNGDDTFRHFGIFDAFEWDPKRGGLFVEFSEKIRPYVFDLVKGNYTKIAGRTMFSLQSSYATRLIELLLQHQGFPEFQKTKIIKRNITVEKLRFYLGIPDDKYKRMGNFRKVVLDGPIEDINKHTSYFMSYDVVKSGAAVIAFDFSLNVSKADEEQQPVSISEVVNIREEARQADIDPTATVDNMSADTFAVLRRYGVGKKVAESLVNQYTDERIRANIQYTLSQKRVQNYGGYIPKAIREDYAAERAAFEQLPLFSQVEQQPQKHKGDGRKLTDAEQRAADKMNAFWYGDNKPKASAEPQNEQKTEPVAAKPIPAPESEPTQKDNDILSVSIETIKGFVDTGREKFAAAELAKLAKKGISIDDVKNHSVDELKELIKAAEAASEKPEKEETAPEPMPVENVSDPEPVSASEQNIFDEVKATPEEEAEANEQERILAQFIEEARAAAAQLNKKELLAIKDSVEKKIPEGKIVELRLQQLKINKYDVYYVVDEFLNE